MRVGIGVVTFNRANRLENTLKKIMLLTKGRYELVVADDGSSDETSAVVRELGVGLVTGENRGVCWNKNRALFYLTQIIGCDVAILVEDDSFPVSEGWQQEWVDAASAYGHVNLAGPWFKEKFLSGAGTAADPIRANVTSGQVTAFSREAVSYVGFLDTRFRGYGVGHVEHSRRLIRAGFGGEISPSGTETFYLINSSVHVENAPSFKNPEDLQRNARLMNQTAQEPLYRAAWRDDSEMNLLRGEISKCRRSVFGAKNER